MNDPMTKTRLLELLRTRRAEWDALLAQIPEGWMTEPGAAGGWSVKDVIAHLTYYERWYADRLEEQMRGENYAPQPIDQMHFDERNAIIYERSRNRPLPDVRADSQQSFERLIAAVEAHTEAFLTEPHVFEGAPGPVRIWEMLRGDVYDHYPLHIPSVKEWLADKRG